MLVASKSIQLSINAAKTSESDKACSNIDGHCRCLALPNDLIYDRFIYHQNYVNQLKAINCCKNCA